MSTILPKNLEVARRAKLRPLNEIAAEMGIVYPICGEMRTMPGLSASPAAEEIDINENGEIVGLF